MERRRASPRLRALAFVGILVFSGCDSKVAPQTPPPVTSVPSETADPSASAPAALPSPAPSPTPPAAVDPTPPTAAALIEAAVDAGKLDPVTGLEYRFYALFADARLPEEFRGAPGEDPVVFSAAKAMVDQLDPADRAKLEPFLVRPTDPSSYWAARAGATASVRLAGFVTAAGPSACSGPFSRLDVASLPVTIWGECSGSTNTLAGTMQQVESFITTLWAPMVRLMGSPIPDEFATGRRGPSEPIEAGDGRLDIYLVTSPNLTYPRDVKSDSPSDGVTPSVAPFKDGTSAAYIVIDPARAASPVELKSTLAHEFFHVLQDRYNATENGFCPYPNVAASCAGTKLEVFWFYEASATWAEHHFVKEARPPEIYVKRYPAFVRSKLGLPDTTGLNEYNSFTWPLLMEQDAGAKDGAVANAFMAMKGKKTWTELQAAVDAQWGFKEHFRDLAVRTWNQDLEPGDPIKPRWQALDTDFPRLQPEDLQEGQGNWRPRFREEQVRLSPSVPSILTREELPELWANYRYVSVDTGLKRLTLNFAGLQPNANLDVDALVLLGNGNWQYRQLDPLVTEYCMEKPEDDVRLMILILSNHSQRPNDPIKGTWEAQADEAGCLTGGDAIQYTFKMESGHPGDMFYSVQTQSMTLHLKLKSAPGIPGGFDDAGTTIRATYDEMGTFTDPFGQCTATGEAHGSRGGTFAPPEDLTGEGLTVSTYQDMDPPEARTFRPEGYGKMSIAAAVIVDVTRSNTSPCGSSSDTETQIVQLKDCVGTEIEDSDPARIFDFHCEFHGDGYEWKVTGKVSVGF